MASRVKFGLGIPNCREGLYYPPSFASPRSIIDIAVMAEDLGFDSVWVNDHFTAPRYVMDMWAKPPNFYDSLVTLAVLANATGTIRLAVAVLVMPIREPVVLAKQVSTLDVFSGGRLILGLGLGAYREEFEASVSSISVAERPKLLDERLAALRELLTKTSASFKGRYTHFTNVELYPRPIQDPLPMYIGGNAPKGMDRVVRFGDGWMPAGLDPEEMAAGVRELQRRAVEAHREPSKIEIAPQFVVCLANSYEEAVNIYKASGHYKHVASLRDSTYKGRSVDSAMSKNLMGTPSDIIEKVDQFAKAGVEHFAAMVFPAERLEDYVYAVRTFAKEVIPSFRRK